MVKKFLIALNNLQQMQETSSEISIQKTGEATRDLIGNKIADKVASVSKKSTKNYKRMKQMWT